MHRDTYEVPISCSGHAETKLERFSGRADKVPAARHFVREALRNCPTVADAVLLASELITNAVTHSVSGQDGSFMVTVVHRAGDIRIEVVDEGGRWATSNRRDSQHGRGLLIVNALSRNWGVSGDHKGRRAWFELDCP